MHVAAQKLSPILIDHATPIVDKINSNLDRNAHSTDCLHIDLFFCSWIELIRHATCRPTQYTLYFYDEGTMHSPGCPQFSLPAPVLPSNPDPLRASASDVSVALREAMDKVTVYEHEVKMLQNCNLYDVGT